MRVRKLLCTPKRQLVGMVGTTEARAQSLICRLAVVFVFSLMVNDGMTEYELRFFGQCCNVAV